MHAIMIRRLVILLATVSSLALAQDKPAGAATPPPDPKPPTAPENPPVEKLDEFRYRIGQVTLDKKSREIRFPTKVNMDQGLLEYLIVLAKGKVHESLLVTEISPTHLNLAFTLLRYSPSPELFSLTDENGRVIEEHPKVSDTVKAGARIAIDLEWIDKGKTRRIAANEWIQHIVTSAHMKAGPWLYTGADIQEGKYIPEITGDLCAIMVDPGGITNYPGDDNGDNVWFAFPKRVPPVGTPVTVIISPYTKTQDLPKP